MKKLTLVAIGISLALLILVACTTTSGPQTTEVFETATPASASQPMQISATETPLGPPTEPPFEREFVTTSKNDDVLVGAYYYPWYDGFRHVHWENHPYLNAPVLGEYTSKDEEVINCHIDWATGHGIDFFAASWWGRFDLTDSNIKALTRAELASEIDFTIIYESVGLLGMEENGEINLSDPAKKERLVSDFTYLANTFFENPNYLKIDGKPVVILYLSRNFVGDIAGAFDAARAAVKDATGQDVFIMGDEVWWQEPDSSRLSVYDGITGYIMHSWETYILENFNEEVEVHYQKWAQAAQEAGIYFIPDVIPGFDDKGYDPGSITPPIPRSLDLFEGQLRIALRLAVGDSKIVLITSWNEWHEDTSIEPAEVWGFDYLDLLQSILDQR